MNVALTAQLSRKRDGTCQACGVKAHSEAGRVGFVYYPGGTTCVSGGSVNYVL